MNETIMRSPLLMNRDDTALLIIDLQEKLLPHILNYRQIEWNIRRLIDGACTMGVKVCATEQYPKGLGPTVESIAKRVNAANPGVLPEKTMFSCRECVPLIDELRSNAIHNLLLVGIETHVCVAQTALDLMGAGFNLFLCADAVGSRFELDHHTALRRVEASGAVVTTTEAALYEWCERAGSDEFKTISKLVQEKGPADNAIGFGR